MTAYFLFKHRDKILGILEQKKIGDSIGIDAKENVFINNVNLTKISYDEIQYYPNTPIVKAKYFNDYLIHNNVVPY